MKIKAHVQNSENNHQIILQTGETQNSIQIPSKSGGFGSSVNGGELLFLALATCYCNDIYREASKRNIKVEQIEVEVDGDFGAEGEPAKNVIYRAKVKAKASKTEIQDLMKATDQVAEIHNSLRVETQIVLEEIQAIPS